MKVARMNGFRKTLVSQVRNQELLRVYEEISSRLGFSENISDEEFNKQYASRIRELGIQSDYANVVKSQVYYRIHDSSYKFQLPEFINGDIRKARILFINKIPGLTDFTEEDCPIPEWSNRKIISYFKNRFKSYNREGGVPNLLRGIIRATDDIIENDDRFRNCKKIMPVEGERPGNMYQPEDVRKLHSLVASTELVNIKADHEHNISKLIDKESSAFFERLSFFKGDVVVLSGVETHKLQGKLEGFFAGRDVKILIVDQLSRFATSKLDKDIETQYKRDCQVRFETNGGTPVNAQKIKKGRTVSVPVPPEKEGFEFKGWYQDSKCRKPFDFGTVIRSDITLYAKWKEKKENKKNPKEPTKPHDKSCLLNPRLIAISAMAVLAVIIFLLLKNCSGKNLPAPIVNQNAVMEIAIKSTDENVLQRVVREYYDYTVEAGDTFYRIADSEYSNIHIWPYLYEANISMHDDPDMLVVNEKLKLPKIPDGGKAYDEYLEQYREDIMDAFFETYSVYVRIGKAYKAVRTLASGELILEGFLQSIKSKIPDEVFSEAKHSVELTKGVCAE